MEYTDGTVKGKTLSLVEIEKRIETLPTTEKVTELIQQAVNNLLNSGNVATTATQKKSLEVTNNLAGTTWVSKTYVAKQSGWYSLYCQNNVGTNTPSAYIDSPSGMSRVNGNAGRDFCCGSVWAKAGDTISYGSIGQGSMELIVFYRDNI